VSSWAVTVSPVVVVVAPIVLITVSRLSRGVARQFRAIWENRRCSILFHLLVPGGRWATLIARPVSAASAASSVFQVRRRLPLAPPLSAVISSLSVSG